MITAIEENLKRGIVLLSSISNEQYSNTSVAPYYSSIGRHMRHILDVFDCIFDGLVISRVDLSARKRNEIVEINTDECIQYFNRIISQLNALNTSDFDKLVTVVDDLGNGLVEQKYTLGGLLIQAHSHAIHHYASLGYILKQLDIQIPDPCFGYNPTTPKNELQELD